MPPQGRTWCSLTASKRRGHHRTAKGAEKCRRAQETSVTTISQSTYVTNVSPHWPRACHQTVVKETVTHHVWGRGACTSGRLSHGPCDLGRSICTRHVLHFPGHARPAGVRLSELAIALVCVLCSSLKTYSLLLLTHNPNHTTVSTDTKPHVRVKGNSTRWQSDHNVRKTVLTKLKNIAIDIS